MANSSSISIAALLLVVVLPMIPAIAIGLSEDPGSHDESSLLSCRLELTSLLPCTTFVQGTTPEPTESCCDNLGDIYRQQPQCLCSFLNTSSSFNSFLPINRTLMLKLPAVCNLLTDDNASACKMVSFREAKNKTASTTRGGDQAGKNNSATAAASPMTQVAPRPTNTVPTTGGFMPSHSPKLLVAVVVRTNFLLSTLAALLACFQL